jgi:transposase
LTRSDSLVTITIPTAISRISRAQNKRFYRSTRLTPHINLIDTGQVVPASEKEPEGWGATDKFTVVLETAGLNATELSAYCRERGLYPEQVERWRQASQDANEKPVLTLKEQKELERLRAQDQKEIKRLKQELRRKEKALAEAAALLIASKKIQAFWGEDGDD